MDAKKAIEAMQEASGRSAYAISKELGHAPHWLAQTLRNGGDAKCSTLRAVAGACGHVLALVPLGEELPPGAIVIDS